MLTQSQIIDLFEYRDGRLYWRKNKKRAGYITPQGYLRIGHNYESTFAHRLIFILHHGYSPEFVDHIDGDKLNNRIENLRAVTRSQNQCNARLRKDSFTGLKNVTRHRNKWQVRIRFNNKLTHIGTFDDLELAEFVASEYRDKYHGEFARHG